MRSAEEMDQADVELRETILKVWSLTGKSKIDLLVPCTPSIGRGRLTVGKIYGGLLILDNWKQTKFGLRPALDRVRIMILGMAISILNSGSQNTNFKIRFQV